jgi:glycerophosphoryl diester phosphodiesterase
MPAINFMCIAHRGASSYAPENTLTAFDLALAMGSMHIELDVHCTRDGQVVVIHDETVDRTTNGTGPVTSYTLAELRCLDAGAWFGAEFIGQRLATYAEILGRYGGSVHIHTEIKGHTAHLAQRTVDLIRQYDMTAQVTITSFQQSPLQDIRVYAPELPTGWLVHQVNETIITRAQQLGVTQLCPLATTVTPALVRHLHAHGFVVRAWGVTTEALMRQVVDAGADGMTVNFPDKLMAYVQSLRQARAE